MTCEERKDLLLLLVAGQLEPSETDALRAHLATGCPQCAGALAEAEATVAQLAAAVPPIALPAGAIERLMKRVDQGDGALRITPARATRDVSARKATSRRFAWLPTLLSVAAAIAITGGVGLYLTRDARSFWRSKNLVTVALVSPTQPGARGQVWWDRDQQQWRVSVSNLNPTPTDREYELWFIPTGHAPMRSQTFHVARDGTQTLIVPVPPGLGDSATAAITDEPLGGSDAPTGKIHLAGEFR